MYTQCEGPARSTVTQAKYLLQTIYDVIADTRLASICALTKLNTLPLTLTGLDWAGLGWTKMG